jgi:hypothetical protein
MERSWNPGPESQISRSWNPVSVYWDPETQVLRANYRGSETQCPFIEILKPKSWEPNIEVLKPNVRLLRSWNPGPESQISRSWNPMSVYRGLETQVLKAKCNNAGLQARADCVRPSRVPTSLIWCHMYSYIKIFMFHYVMKLHDTIANPIMHITMNIGCQPK